MYSTKSGLKYQFHSIGSGRPPADGESVKVNYIGRLADGTEFDNSYKRGAPFVFKVGNGSVIPGWEEGILLMKPGSKATFTIPPQLAYGDSGYGNIPPRATLMFDIELLQVIPPPKPFNVKGLDTLKMESGLAYIKVKSLDEAQKAEAFRIVKVHYTGYLENGEIFDSSVERGEPISFKLGVGSVIKGWDEGISYLRKGEKARLIIPPNLAYGKRGIPPMIPPDATLIFDVELIDIFE